MEGHGAAQGTAVTLLTMGDTEVFYDLKKWALPPPRPRSRSCLANTLRAFSRIRSDPGSASLAAFAHSCGYLSSFRISDKLAGPGVGKEPCFGRQAGRWPQLRTSHDWQSSATGAM